MDQTDYIRNKIRSAYNNRPAQSISIVPEIPTEEKSGFLKTFLTSCCVLLSLAMTVAITAKGMGWKLPWKQKTTPAVQPIVIHSHNHEPARQVQSEDYSAAIASIDAKVTKLDEAIKKCNNRVWLLGIAHNENTVMTKNINQKYHPNEANDYLTFDRDWKINRLPRTMMIDGEDAETIRRAVR